MIARCCTLGPLAFRLMPAQRKAAALKVRWAIRKGPLRLALYGPHDNKNYSVLLMLRGTRSFGCLAISLESYTRRSSLRVYKRAAPLCYTRGHTRVMTPKGPMVVAPPCLVVPCCHRSPPPLGQNKTAPTHLWTENRLTLSGQASARNSTHASLPQPLQPSPLTVFMCCYP